MSMATVYRDYGAIGRYSTPENQVEITPRRQVYQATHEGEARLPFMRRSFISFTYGGRYIEDFDLIATISGDRMEKDGYAPFNDLTTDYDILEGQQYWGTHYKAKTLTFNLATDGIDQKTLDDFLHWFQAGVSRELILAEHPNRVALARVAQPPQLSVLPFEHHTTMKISENEYPIITTLYKGEITLQLVMDEPHWHAKDNILGILVDSDLNLGVDKQRYIDYWEDFYGNPVEIFASADALKILYEDGIPLGSNIQNNMLLGNGTFANVENDYDSLIWSIPEAQIISNDGEINGQGARIAGTITELEFVLNSYCLGTNTYDSKGDPDYHWLETEDGGKLFFNVQNNINPISNKEFIMNWPGEYHGKIAGAIIDVSGNGITSLANDSQGYFFYAGTAPSPAKVTFTFTPTLNEGYYIDSPYNKVDNFFNNRETSDTRAQYNKFIITSEDEQILKFTTPNFLTSYNRAIRIFDTRISMGSSWETIINDIRDKVRHPVVRKWATRILTEYKEISGGAIAVAQEQLASMKSDLAWLITKEKRGGPSGDLLFPMTVSFDSKTGTAIGTIKYRTPIDTGANKFNIADIIGTTTITEVDNEDVGDMLYSNYIVINNRNYPNSKGEVVGWQDTAEGHRYSHKITHDMPNPLTNIKIEYQNMYF